MKVCTSRLKSGIPIGWGCAATPRAGHDAFIIPCPDRLGRLIVLTIPTVGYDEQGRPQNSGSCLTGQRVPVIDVTEWDNFSFTPASEPFSRERRHTHTRHTPDPRGGDEVQSPAGMKFLSSLPSPIIVVYLLSHSFHRLTELFHQCTSSCRILLRESTVQPTPLTESDHVFQSHNFSREWYLSLALRRSEG